MQAHTTTGSPFVSLHVYFFYLIYGVNTTIFYMLQVLQDELANSLSPALTSSDYCETHRYKLIFFFNYFLFYLISIF